MSTHLPRVADEGEAGWAGRAMAWLRFAVRLIAVNLLVLLGTLAGAVLVGLAPALAAGSALTAGLAAGAWPERPWQAFWAGWRGGLRRVNLLALPLWAAVLVLGADASVVAAAPPGPVRALAVPLFLLGAYLVVVAAFFPPVVRRYERGFGATWRFLAVAPLVSPGTTVSVLALAVATAALDLRFAVLLPLVGLSLPLLATGWVVDLRLDRIDARRVSPPPPP